jgi:glycyl-tRNA synthetase alpha chain
MYRRHFDEREAEANALIDAGLVHPGYDAVIKCSHLFNVLEARGAISVTERTGYIKRVRAMARRVAKAHLEKREAMGFPLLKTREADSE